MPTGLFKTFSAAEHRQILRAAAIAALAGERPDLFGRLENSIVHTAYRDVAGGGVTVEFTLAERHDLPGQKTFLDDSPAQPAATRDGDSLGVRSEDAATTPPVRPAATKRRKTANLS